MKKGRFWVEDEFIDIYACRLSLKAQTAYFCLCRHANKAGQTFIGKKRIAKLTGMSILSAQRALKELEGVYLVTPYQKLEGIPVKGRGILRLPLGGNLCIPKELGIIKEVEKQNFLEIKKQIQDIKKQYHFLK